MRGLGPERMYLLGATVFSPGFEEADLAGVTRLKKRSAAKLHWRDLGINAQASVMHALSVLPSMTSVVIGSAMQANKQERARRKCLERLITILEQNGVSRFVLESRGDALDRQDIRFMDALRASGQAKSLRVFHMKGSEEPRLWVPDQILGAYGDILCGVDKSEAWKLAWSELEPKTDMEVVYLS